MSPEVAHHYFYYHIKGYYDAGAGSYIKRCREETPKLWEHVNYLYAITNEVEHGTMFRDKGKLKAQDISKFLTEECAAPRVLSEDKSTA
jgi:hypothetical protein